VIRLAIIIALMAAPASAQTLTCSTSFQGYRVCQGPDGYRSTESTWNGIITGSDNRGDTWTTSTWQDDETTAGSPPRDER
jgi:hypothetical protein